MLCLMPTNLQLPTFLIPMLDLMPTDLQHQPSQTLLLLLISTNFQFKVQLLLFPIKFTLKITVRMITSSSRFAPHEKLITDIGAALQEEHYNPLDLISNEKNHTKQNYKKQAKISKERSLLGPTLHLQ